MCLLVLASSPVSRHHYVSFSLRCPYHVFHLPAHGHSHHLLTRSTQSQDCLASTALIYVTGLSPLGCFVTVVLVMDSGTMARFSLIAQPHDRLDTLYLERGGCRRVHGKELADKTCSPSSKTVAVSGGTCQMLDSPIEDQWSNKTICHLLPIKE